MMIDSTYIIIIVGFLILLILVWHTFNRHSRNTHHSREKFQKSKSLYDRLGGIFSIAAVVNRFSDELIKNPIVGINSSNQQLREWSRTKTESRLSGLKWLRTLWLADVAGGPYKFIPSSGDSMCPFISKNTLKTNASETNATTNAECRLNLTKAHCPFKITSAEFNATADELTKALDYFEVPTQEKNEVLSAFAAHKSQVTHCAAH